MGCYCRKCLEKMDFSFWKMASGTVDITKQLEDLHVYLVPAEIWRERFNNMLNQSVTDTVSLGIIRVPPEIKLFQVRNELDQQLEDLIPPKFVFLRSVGRSLTRVKANQEATWKAKHFLPPTAYAPELFLLETNADVGTSLGSDAESQVSFRQMGESPRYNQGYNTYRDDYREPGSKNQRDRDYRDRDRDRNRDKYRDRDQSRDRYGNSSAADLQNENSSRIQRGSDKSSPSRRYTPLPKIDPSSPTGSRNASPERTDRSDRNYRSRSPERFDSDSRYDQRRNEDSRNDDYRKNVDRDDRDDDRRRDEKEDKDDRSDSPNRRNGYDDRYNDNRYDNRYADQDRKSVHESRNYEDKYGRESPDRSRAYDRNAGSETYRRNSPEADKDVNGYPVLPPINDIPPRSAERSPRKQGENKDSRSATYTTNTNTDSGIAGVSPEDQYHRGRDNYEEENARKRRELRNRLDNDKFDAYDDDAYNLDDIEERDQIDRERWERDREYRRQWIEEERRRREEEEARKKRQEAGEDDDDDDERKKMKRSDSEEELARYPSPPELDMGSPRETESAKERIREEKERLMEELESARENRKGTEKEREELVRKAKQLQNRTQNRRNHARDIWKKRYFEEKKKTAPLEEQTNRLRHELENIHRKLMSTLEGPKEKNIKLNDAKPSPKNNYIIQCTRLQHEIEDLRRRVENAKMKLTAEMKLRTQADAELRAVRSEAIESKIRHRGQAFTQIY